MPATTPRYWTAATTTWGEERRAAYHLERAGFKFYLPQFRDLGSDGEFTRRRLLMPGYILVKLREGWEAITHLQGIHRVLLVDYLPLHVRKQEIETLREMEDEEGFIRFGPRLSTGDLVRVGPLGGAYAHRRGKIVTKEGNACMVLLRFMGREVRKLFDERMLTSR
jgi:transcription antitermination factor NusG